jgi:hypothetical protein
MPVYLALIQKTQAASSAFRSRNCKMIRLSLELRKAGLFPSLNTTSDESFMLTLAGWKPD